jgi:Thioredoxin
MVDEARKRFERRAAFTRLHGRASVGEDSMSYEIAFANGVTFPQFLKQVSASRELWSALARRRPDIDAAMARMGSLPGRWRLLVLAEDWCGDAVNIVPVVARLAEEAGNIDLRIIRRDEYPDIMKRHLTAGARSIPIVVLLDEHSRVSGWWGPRPAALQQWFQREGRALPAGDRYRELRRWYARDRGFAIAGEIADLIRCASAGDATYAGNQPCAPLVAAGTRKFWMLEDAA